MPEFGGEDVSLLSHPDPVVLELNRLQNQLRGSSFLLHACLLVLILNISSSLVIKNQ